MHDTLHSPSDEVVFPAWLTPWSLAGLGGAVALGVLGKVTDWRPAFDLAGLLAPLGSVWMGALKVIIVPLVLIQVGAAVLKAPSGGRLGRLTVKALGLFAIMLVGAGALTALLAPGVVALFGPGEATVEAIASGLAGDMAVPETPASGFSWTPPLPTLVGLLTGEDLLSLLVLAGLAALALRRLPEDRRDRVKQLVDRASVQILRVVRLVLLATPVGVFAIVLPVALEAGVGTAGVAVAFVVLSSAWLLFATLLLYPLTVALSPCSMRDFAQALAPAQLVGVSTRSSLAALPALVEEGERQLHLPPEGTGVVLPLAASLYKVGRPLQTTFELVFLAHIAGVELSAAAVGVFILTVVILYLGDPGIPGGAGAMRSLPAFMAAGVPLEGYFFIQALGTIPDIFETLVHVTAYMSSAVILTHPDGASAPTETPPESAASVTPTP